MSHSYYSQRTGSNPNPDGLPLPELIDLFVRVYEQLDEDQYFVEAFGQWCPDAEWLDGKIRDVPLAMLLAIRKKDLWPIAEKTSSYSEDDLFDVIEFLYQHVSKPVDGWLHNYGGCGKHWDTFNGDEGRKHYQSKVNEVLAHYSSPFELSRAGEVLRKPEAGFEAIFEADVPTDDSDVSSRVRAATLQYRRHGATVDDRRQAVRDLADVLEFLRPSVKELLTHKDEQDLFAIANNFGIRHHNDQQRTAYDRAIWLSWMFYFYLATIHVVLRKMRHDERAT